MFSRFRTKLILLVMLAVVPAFLLALYTYAKQRGTERARANDGVKALAKLIAANQEALIQSARQQLATLAEFDFLVLSTSRLGVHIHLANLLKLSPNYLNFGLIETNGMLFTSSVTEGETNVSLADRSYFQRAMVTGAFSIGDYQVGRLTGEEGLNFGFPIREDGAIRRVLFASLKLDLLTKAAGAVRLPEGAAVTVLDSTGTLVARLPEPDKWVGKNVEETEFTRQALNLGDGAFSAPGLDGIERFYAAASIFDDTGERLCVTLGIPTEVLFSEADETAFRSLVVMGAITIAAFGATSLLANRFVLLPVQALAGAAHRLAGGDLSARAEVRKSSVEFRDLAGAFNHMAERLQARQTEIESAKDTIQRMNEDLERRVAERTAQLAEANRELESFSYSVSHDLRAPLRHMDGFSQLLSKHSADRLDEKGRRYLEVISAAARKMGTLIDELLVFSRMGRQELSRQRVETGRMAAEVIAELTPESEGRSIEWKIGELPEVEADASMLRQVWINLLSNAIKYTRPREHAVIEIGADSDPSEFRFWVRDNGVGFDMRYAAKLFGVFQRLHLDSEFEGTGIGLANVRRIVTRHGGRTWAESVLGQGSAFYFTLPK